MGLWDLGGRGPWLWQWESMGQSVTLVGKWTNSGFKGWGGAWQRGSRGDSVTLMVKWTNSRFVGPGGRGPGAGQWSAAVSWGRGVIPSL